VTSTVGERSKDALTRMNELIRQNSIQDMENKGSDEVFEDDKDALISSIKQDKRRLSKDLSSIQYYINETNKLTDNLEISTNDQPVIKQEHDKKITTNLDDVNIQQVKYLIHIQSRTKDQILGGFKGLFTAKSRRRKLKIFNNCRSIRPPYPIPSIVIYPGIRIQGQ
jgi:hypothetical protein